MRQGGDGWRLPKKNEGSASWAPAPLSISARENEQKRRSSRTSSSSHIFSPDRPNEAAGAIRAASSALRLCRLRRRDSSQPIDSRLSGIHVGHIPPLEA